MTRKKRPSVVGFLVGALVGVLVALAGVMFKPVRPASAVAFDVCGELIGLVVTYTDGHSVGLAPMNAKEVDVERLLADVGALDKAQKKVIRLGGSCRQPAGFGST